MKQYQCKQVKNDVEDVDVESRKVKAVWARTSNVDLDSDIILPTAFTKTISERGPKGKNLRVEVQRYRRLELTDWVPA